MLLRALNFPVIARRLARTKPMYEMFIAQEVQRVARASPPGPPGKVVRNRRMQSEEYRAKVLRGERVVESTAFTRQLILPAKYEGCFKVRSVF